MLSTFPCALRSLTIRYLHDLCKLHNQQWYAKAMYMHVQPIIDKSVAQSSNHFKDRQRLIRCESSLAAMRMFFRAGKWKQTLRYALVSSL